MGQCIDKNRELIRVRNYQRVLNARSKALSQAEHVARLKLKYRF